MILHNKSEFEKAVYDKKFRVLITAEQIQTRIKELGKQITKDYREKNPIMIGILNGSFIFFADLVRNIETDIEIDFMKISSYGDEKISSGRINELKTIDADITNRHVLIVEDIVDTGLSLKYIEKKLTEQNPASCKFVSLLYKKEAVKVDVNIDYLGFEIKNEFVVGYGLDHKQILRNLSEIYVLD